MQPFTLQSLLPHLWIAGRSSRREWWQVHIVCAVFATIVDQMFIARLERGFGGLSNAPVTLLWLAITALLAWVSFASVVRRLNDRGKSPWLALLYLVPGIGWLWLIIECGFLPGRAPAETGGAETGAAATRAAALRAEAARLLATAAAARKAAEAVPAAREPAFTPRQAERHRPSRAPIGTAPRVGTIQRVEYQPWTAQRAMKLAGNALGLMLMGFVLYKWFFDAGSEAMFTITPQQPATIERVE